MTNIGARISHWVINILVLYFLHLPLSLLFGALGMTSIADALSFTGVPLIFSLAIYFLVFPVAAIYTIGEVASKLRSKESLMMGDWFRSFGLMVMAVFVIQMLIQLRNSSW